MPPAFPPPKLNRYRSLAQSRRAGEAETYEIIAGVLEQTIAFLEGGKACNGDDLPEGEEPPPTELLFALLYVSLSRESCLLLASHT